MTPTQLADDLEGLLISWGQPTNLPLSVGHVRDIVAVLRSTEAVQLPPEANELAAMMRDAARYRWLREHSWLDTSLIKSVLNFGPGYQQTKPEVLDTTIDAALDGTRKP